MKRKSSLGMAIGVLGMCAVVSIFGQSRRYVMAAEQSVPVYAMENSVITRTVLFSATQDMRFPVLMERDYYYLVQNPDGASGWVEKKRVTLIGRGTVHTFGAEAVTGYIENPDAWFIPGDNARDTQIIRLDRSFRDNLRINVDRETVSRTAP